MAAVSNLVGVQSRALGGSFTRRAHLPQGGGVDAIYKAF